MAELSQLRTLLNQLFEQYHRPEFLTSDPLEFPHRYADPWDQEAVALLAALLAYGNVKQIRRSVEEVLRRIHRVSTGPAAFIRALDPAGAGGPAFSGFVHRFNNGADLELLFLLLQKSWREHGSLGSHFVSFLEPGDEDTSDALSALIAEWRAWIRQSPALRARFRKSPSFSYLLTSPDDGSCCKRWCMFLRWVGRKERDSHAGMDLGLWSEGSPLARETFPPGRWLRSSQLIIPLDTHTGRISQYLGLTERKSLNWLAAVEVTRSLRLSCDAEDPTRYDFALARLGILDLCQRRYREEICNRCALLHACRFSSVNRQKTVS
jgi:uncharacterized protein (TIGR02757 family)